MFTNIKVTPVKGQGKLRARGKVTVANVMNVNFSVAEGANGLFVGLPSHQDPKDKTKYWPDVFIEDKKVYAELTKKVLEVYQAQVSGASQSESPAPEDQSNGLPF